MLGVFVLGGFWSESQWGPLCVEFACSPSACVGYSLDTLASSLSKKDGY